MDKYPKVRLFGRLAEGPSGDVKLGIRSKGEPFQDPIVRRKSLEVRRFGSKFAVTYRKCPAELDW